MIEVFSIFAEHGQDHPHHGEVVSLAISADQIGLTPASSSDDVEDCRVVVIDMDPVANVLSGAVKFRTNSCQYIGNLPRNKLLYVLTRSIII